MLTIASQENWNGPDQIQEAGNLRDEASGFASSYPSPVSPVLPLPSTLPSNPDSISDAVSTDVFPDVNNSNDRFQAPERAQRAVTRSQVNAVLVEHETPAAWQNFVYRQWDPVRGPVSASFVLDDNIQLFYVSGPSINKVAGTFLPWIMSKIGHAVFEEPFDVQYGDFELANMFAAPGDRHFFA